MMKVESRVLSWRSNAHAIAGKTSSDQIALRSFCAVLSEIHRRQWLGACHASSVVLFALLRTQGLSAGLFIGEVQVPGGSCFDHSWIELDGQVFDAAISLGLQARHNQPPVFHGIDLQTKKATGVRYAYVSGLGYGPDATDVLVTPVVDYARAFPAEVHPRGLIGMATAVAKRERIPFREECGLRALECATWNQKPRTDP